MDQIQAKQGPSAEIASKITALIVSRNSAEALRACLTALQSSTVRDRLEIIVVDNGSRDGTADLQSDFPAVTFLRLPKNFGRTKALNIGTRTAKTEIILLLRPEVKVASNTVAVMADRLEHDVEAGAVCASVIRAYAFPDAKALANACVTGELPNPVVIDHSAGVVAVDYPAGAPMLVWKRFLKGMNYLDERYGEHWADLELCYQIRNSGKKILVLPEAEVQYGQRSASTDPIDSADCASGAAAYIGKRYGFLAGMKFRIAAILTSLLRALTFREPGYNLKRLTALATGQKIDGTQE